MDKRLKLTAVEIDSPYGRADSKIMREVLRNMIMFNHSLNNVALMSGISKPTIKAFFSAKTRTQATRDALISYVNKLERLVDSKKQQETIDEMLKKF